jgi:hypothetical protein
LQLQSSLSQEITELGSIDRPSISSEELQIAPFASISSPALPTLFSLSSKNSIPPKTVDLFSCLAYQQQEEAIDTIRLLDYFGLVGFTTPHQEQGVHVMLHSELSFVMISSTGAGKTLLVMAAVRSELLA